MELLVATTAGKVSGFEKDGVVQFRGVPYAAPPVGPRRFLPPQPVEPWDGVRSCAAFGNSSVQTGGGLEAMLGSSRVPTGEDCLFLNVFTPAADDRPRPTMVWLHGGGFLSGSGSVPWYNGARLATGGDVVVVTVNYRLGALGYLYLGGALGDDYAASGNNGLLDQVAALTWVRDNIANFGGDPDNVTIFGESAGGMSVGTLLGTPAATGLFHRAIPQSGAAHTVFDTATASAVTGALLAELGLTPDGAAAIPDLPADDILAAQSALTPAKLKAAGLSTDAALTLPLRPVVDGTTLPVPPLDAVRAGSAATVPLVIGTTRDEWNLFSAMNPLDTDIDEGDVIRRVAARTGDADRAAAIVAAYKAARPGATAPAVWSAIQTDAVFRIPAVRLAEAQLDAGGQVFMYRFDRGTPAFGGVLGACHAIEIPYVFDNLGRKGVEALLGPIDDDALAVAAAISGAWLAFAQTGAPGWPAYDTDRRATKIFGTPTTIADDPEADLRQLWSGIV